MSGEESLRTLLRGLEGDLARAGVDSPRLSVRLLAAHVLGLAPVEIVLQGERVPTPSEAEAIRALCARRAAGEPAAYILGEREFFGLSFLVEPGVLIPRPETEHIVEEAERLFPDNPPITFADYGVGSGALAVTLAARFPRSRGVALDLSPTALGVARKNAARHGVADRLLFVLGDFAAPVVKPGSLDVAVSNPPYVSEVEYGELCPEVARFEPREALTPGPEGLESARALAPRLFEALRPGGVALVEHGFAQGEAMSAILGDVGFIDVRVLRDLAGLDRIVHGRRP